MENKQDLKNKFDWWITCIPDKIDALRELIPLEIYSKLDYSIVSLEILGKYITKTSSIDSLMNEKNLWDCYASYVGTTYRRNVTTARWTIELEDIANIYYNIPLLKTEAFTTFAPHYEITTMLSRKLSDFLVTIIKKHIEQVENRVRSRSS